MCYVQLVDDEKDYEYYALSLVLYTGTIGTTIFGGYLMFNLLFCEFELTHELLRFFVFLCVFSTTGVLQTMAYHQARNFCGGRYLFLNIIFGIIERPKKPKLMIPEEPLLFKYSVDVDENGFALNDQ